MSKQKSGVFPMLLGAVFGAAAVFFSDKKNRVKASKTVMEGKAQLKKLSAEAKKDPEAFARKVAKKVSSEAKKVGAKAKKLGKKLSEQNTSSRKTI